MTVATVPAPDVTLRVPFWLVKREGLASGELVGEVLKLTDRGVQVRATVSVRPSDHCHRCGRPIEHPVSLLIGYGPYCAADLGIEYAELEQTELDRIRVSLAQQHVRDVWLPRRFVTVVDGTLQVRPTETADAPAPSTNGDAPADADMPVVTLRVARIPGEGEDRLLVFSPFRLKDAIKALPGRRWAGKDKVPVTGAWHFPATSASARTVETMARSNGCRVKAEDGADVLLEQAERASAAIVHKSAEELPDVPSKTTAWHHQRQAFHFAREQEAAMLAMDMGTGKSKVAVDLACAEGAGRILIVCPKSVLGVWPREFERHGLCDVNVVAPRKGTIVKRVGDIVDELSLGVPTAVVVNYESAWREPMADLLLKTKWDLVILDESHRIKAPGGKASMFCGRLRRAAKRRLCLTGTPMPHSPLDVYAQYRFLDPGIFGTSFAAFRARYAIMGGYGGHEVLGYQRQDELAEKMYSVGFRVMANDVLDLPDPVWATRTTTLSPRAAKVYRELESELVGDVGDGTVTAANALTRILRLQQATSGWLPLDDPSDEGEREWVEIDTAKRDLLADVLDDLPVTEPVVVVCRFTRDLDNVQKIAEAQGRRYAELSGRRSDGLTDHAEMRPDVDVLGVQIQSGGVGIDLTRSHYAINYSVGYSLGDWEQWLKRTHRPGQDEQVRYINLACEGTKDEEVLQALRERKSLVEYVLGLAS